MFKKVLIIFLGVILIALGIRVFIFFGDFNVVVGTIIAILGVGIIIAGFGSSSAGKETVPPETDEDEPLMTSEYSEASDVAKEAPHTDAAKKKMPNRILLIIFVGLLVFGAVQLVGVAGNWLSPETKLSEGALLNELSDANVIEMKGQLRSTNDYTYLYANDERVGTVEQTGLKNMSWQYKNKDSVFYTMSYSDHQPVEDDFQAYQFSGEKTGVLGYGQTSLEDHQKILYFYDADDKPVGYVNVETAYASYRDQWTVYDMDGSPVYDVKANYSALKKQLTYTISKLADSQVNVLQVMGINFLTRRDIRERYK